MKRFILLAILSAVIFEARGDGLLFALVAAAVAAAVAVRLPQQQPPPQLRPLGVLTFLPFFFVESVRGGLDVALRAFRGRGALHPGFIDFELRLDHPTALIMFVNAVSLMPGTFTARIHAERLHVHTLDTRENVEPRLRRVEDRIRAMFVESAP
jgi:multicomponent Na+:H+ antiporter subunit E